VCPEVGLAEATRTVALIEAAYRSAEQVRTIPVEEVTGGPAG
jgi:hypothetical protein